MHPRYCGVVLVLVLLLLGGVVAGCNDSESPGGDRRKLSLIWISLDTLRADHLGLYGYERDTSPFLDELGRKGLWFDWAVAPQNSTLPSHMTMFTGYHPLVHGIMHSAANPGIRLAQSVKTLPQVLQESGYVTHARTDGVQLDSYYGFARGFESYVDEAAPFEERCDRVLREISDLSSDELFFYFVHTYEIHHPYEPPAPYDTRYPPPDPKNEADVSISGYDGSIRYVNDELEKFVGELEKRGILDRAVLVITGDHGEAFHENEIPFIGHGGHTLHQNITRVPWIILHPHEELQGRGKIDSRVGLHDFCNTVLPLIGFDETLGEGGSNALSPDVGGSREFVSYSGKAWSLYRGDYHLLRSEDFPGSKRNVLYDVVSDPSEVNRVSAGDEYEAMSRRLGELRTEFGKMGKRLTSNLREFGEIPDQVENQLKALGYSEEEEEIGSVEKKKE